MKITVKRSYDGGVASRTFDVRLIRSLGDSDEEFGCPAILILLESGKQGIFRGEFEAHEETGITAHIKNCLYGVDLFV